MHAGKDFSPPVTSVQHKPLYNINGWLMSWADTTGIVIVFIIAAIYVITINIIQNLPHHHPPTRGGVDDAVLKYAVVKITLYLRLLPPLPSSSETRERSHLQRRCSRWFLRLVSSHFLAANIMIAMTIIAKGLMLWSFTLRNYFLMLLLCFPVPLL